MKLRAWNKRLRKLERVVCVDFNSCTVTLVQKDSDPLFMYKEDIQNVVLMQYLAKDAEGNDLYVGDMVKYKGVVGEIVLKDGIISLKGFKAAPIWGKTLLLPND